MNILIIFYLWESNQIITVDFKIYFIHNTIRRLRDNPRGLYIIMNKIRNGKAHELSEADTLYLSACTKCANSKISCRSKIFEVKAKRRAFAFKNKYMTNLFNNSYKEAFSGEKINKNGENIALLDLLNLKFKNILE